MAFLLTFISLLLSWSAAYLAATLLSNLAYSTGLIHAPVVRIFRLQGKRANTRGLQKILFTMIWIELTFLVSQLLDASEPLRQITEIFLQAVRFKITPDLITGILSNFVLVLGVFVIFQVLVAVQKIFPQLELHIKRWGRDRFRIIRIKRVELFTPDQIVEVLVSLNRYARILLTGALCVVGVTYTFSFFPITQQIAAAVVDHLVALAGHLSTAVSAFLPKLITLLFVAIIARYALRLLRFFYEGIENGKVKIPGLHRELAEPTYQLLRIMTIALAIVAAYPYLPGSDSPVFRGITIFIGFLLSIGSTALVTNVVSGIVLTYTRGLRIGDRVSIGATTGDVIERTLLVTRLCTIKNVVVSIPNSMVLNNEIINYSAQAKQDNLILNTSVTIGYDVPWRQVHELLIQAALTTRSILPSPNPFVLQTSLDDYYVSYELNAYTAEPRKMAVTYSELHQNIQDCFNAAEVEIMSPAYTALRADDGAAILPIPGKK